jgi:hypothetical protein
MPSQFEWEAPPLDSRDGELVDAYVAVGRSLDDLPYTEDFERIRRMVHSEDSDDARHMLFRRLLRLRKMGRLPRVGR